MGEPPLSGLPTRAALHDSGVYFALRQIAPEQLEDAFLYETIARLPGPETYVQVATADLGAVPPGTAPAGIVFHVARCGSTLVSQLLKQHRGAVVYAEPAPVNDILVPPHRWPRARLAGALRSLGESFARHAGRPYVLKLSSWSTLFCDVVAEAFPETPWVICVRDPIEVAVSLLADLPPWLNPSDERFALFANIVDPARGSRPAADH